MLSRIFVAPLVAVVLAAVPVVELVPARVVVELLPVVLEELVELLLSAAAWYKSISEYTGAYLQTIHLECQKWLGRSGINGKDHP